MSTRNPYAVLGLPPGADATAARTAFRRVAMTCHPDRAPGDHGARQRFEEARAAYSRILATRRALDRMDALRSAPQPPFKVEPQQAPRPRQSVITAIIDLPLTPREAIHGGLKRIKGPDGAVLVRVPKGARDGDRLRGGDLLVLTIRIAQKAGFAANGDDITGTIDIAPALIATGGRTDIDTPHGKLRVTIPAGIPDGARLRLAGRGLPSRGNRPTGDLYLTIRHKTERTGTFTRMMALFGLVPPGRVAA